MKRKIKIVSGGQTGADRAALAWALRNRVPHGGWVPKGRLAEDGQVPARYHMQETPTKVLTQRTDWNVRDSDSTVIFTVAGRLGRGSRRTMETAKRLRKPCLVLCEEEVADSAVRLLKEFIRRHRVRVLNVAGSRASQEPRVGRWVKRVLDAAFRR